MKAIDPSYIQTRQDEFLIWREANTVFMGGGHAGCSPYGLALAAMRRMEKRPVVHTYNCDRLCYDWNENQFQLDVMAFMMDYDRVEALNKGIVVDHDKPMDAAFLRDAMKEYHPIILVYYKNQAHWVYGAAHNPITDALTLYDPWPYSQFFAESDDDMPIYPTQVNGQNIYELPLEFVMERTTYQRENQTFILIPRDNRLLRESDDFDF